MAYSRSTFRDIESTYDYYDGDEPEYGICACCGDFVQPVRTDVGIGRYEYWGAVGTDVRYEWLSPCCEADVVLGGSVVVRTMQRRASKDYPNDRIAKGDLYQETVEKNWRTGGPSWFRVTRKPYYAKTTVHQDT